MKIQVKEDDGLFRPDAIKFIGITQRLVLVRGPSGSGKSTFARYLQSVIARHGHLFGSLYPPKFENDDYFTKNGGYNWSKDKMPEAINECKTNTLHHLLLGKSVIVANTFVTIRSMLPYFNMAKALGIPVVVFRMTGKHKNVHNVPADVVKSMEANFQKYDYEIETDGVITRVWTPDGTESSKVVTFNIPCVIDQ